MKASALSSLIRVTYVNYPLRSWAPGTDSSGDVHIKKEGPDVSQHVRPRDLERTRLSPWILPHTLRRVQREARMRHVSHGAGALRRSRTNRLCLGVGEEAAFPEDHQAFVRDELLPGEPQASRKGSRHCLQHGEGRARRARRQGGSRIHRRPHVRRRDRKGRQTAGFTRSTSGATRVRRSTQGRKSALPGPEIGPSRSPRQ